MRMSELMQTARDAVYLELDRSRRSKRARKSPTAIVVDYDAEGRIVGVETSRCVEADG